MLPRWLFLLTLAACNGGDAGTEETDTTTPLPEDPCVDGGPDAPVVAALEPDVWDFQAFPVVSFVPEHPRGVIFYFHGGPGVDEVAGIEHTAQLWNLMADKLGFAVVATQRTLPGADDSWSEAPNGADAQRMVALRDELIATTGLEEDTPVVLSGFSDGAGMSTGFVDVSIEEFGWPVIASTPHNAAFGDAPSVPTQFHIGEHDLDGAVSGLDRVTAELEDEGTVYEAIEVPERVLEVEQFLREPNWDLEKAQACFDDLVAGGLIDASGVRLVSDAAMEVELSRWSRASELQAPALCEARVRVLWGTHRYSAWAGQRECQFILDAMP